MRSLAIIGDIVASRSVPDREVFQRHFIQHVEALNHAPWRLPGDLASPFTVTLGDEFQALYTDPARIMLDVWELAANLAPTALRVSIAIGELTTDTNTEAAIGMDGPAFHLARDGMDRLLKPRKQRLCITADPPLPLEHAAAALIGELVAKFKPLRIRILARHARGEPVAEIASALNTTPQNIYRHMDTGMIQNLSQLGLELGAALRDRLSE